MNVKISVLALLIAVFATLCAVSRAEIVQVHVVTRHCDRAPYVEKQIPNDPVDWKQAIGVTYGQLTAVGMQQCYKLGESIRSRYLDQGQETSVTGIHASFDPADYKFYCTQYDRTLMSIYSASLAMFQGKGPNSDLDGEPGLPYNTQPVPVNMIPIQDDTWLRGYDKCPAVKKNLDAFYNSPKFAELEKKYQDVVDKVVNLTGASEYTFKTFYMLADMINVQRVHNLLKIQELVDMYPQIQEAGDASNYAYFSREVQGGLGAGELVGQVLSQMQQAIQTPDKALKYLHYSSHDSSIQSIFASLGLSSDYPELQEIPPYGSAFAFELHKENNQHFVRLVFKKGFAGNFTSYALKTLGGTGCEEKCDVKKFEDIANKDVIPKSWCEACGNDSVGKCVSLMLSKTQTGNTVMIVVIPSLLGVVAVLLIVVLVLAIKLFRTRNQYEKV